MAELFATFGIDWRLLIIQAVNFSVLLAALSYFLYTPLLKVIEERRSVAAKGVKDAAEAKEKLAHADSERSEIVGAATKEADRIVGHAREHALILGQDILNDAREQADSVVKEAQLRAETIATDAVRDSEAGIARAAVLAAEKILSQK